MSKTMTLAEEFEARVQHRRNEAWECRVAGYIACGFGALLIAAAVILCTVFGVPSAEASLGWLIIPGVVIIILGCVLVIGGVLEAY